MKTTGILMPNYIWFADKIVSRINIVMMEALLGNQIE